jgi:Uncharacterized protein conserved in bacteria (DUF2252)
MLLMIADIETSRARYEAWLRQRLGAQLVEDDLEEKHKKMQAGPFPFLRATYWRWAEIIQGGGFEIVAGAPQVKAVGDIHLENYGVWRDGDGRLVWGVNDFDEAAGMPYVCDLLRLAVSAALAPVAWVASIPNICASIERGYRDGLKKRRAFVLDRDNAWLRQQFEVDNGERAEFWAKIAKRRQEAKDAADRKGRKRKSGPKSNKPPSAYRAALIKALPDGSLEPEFWPSDAGTGSLGRPRWVVYARWRGAPVIREAKAVVPSAWTYAARISTDEILCEAVANGRFRAPDPCYRLSNNLVLRRLSPNSRKLEVENYGAVLVDPRMLRLMGHDLANVHLGTGRNWEARADKIKQHLKTHRHEPFVRAVDGLAKRVIADQAAYVAKA